MVHPPRHQNQWAESTEVQKQRVPVVTQNGNLSTQNLKKNKIKL